MSVDLTFPNPIQIRPSRESLLAQQSNELILQENSERWVLLPIEFPSLWEFYKMIETGFWTPDDFNWKQEKVCLKNSIGLDDTALSCLLGIGVALNLSLGVPVSCVGLKNEVNGFLFPDVLELSCELVEAIQTPEGRAYLGFQSMFENFHREVFTKYIETLLGPVNNSNEEALRKLYLDCQDKPAIVAKQKWLAHHLEGFHHEGKVKVLAGDKPDVAAQSPKRTEHPAPIAEILIALLVYKGFFFSSLQVIRAICLNNSESAFVHSAKQLSKDVILHGDFVAHLYNSLTNKLDPDILKSMLVQAAELEFNAIMELLGGWDENGPNLLRHQADRVPLREAIGSYLKLVYLHYMPILGFTDEKELAFPPSNIPGSTSTNDFIEGPQPLHLKYRGAFKIVPEEKRAIQEQIGQVQQRPVFKMDDDF